MGDSPTLWVTHWGGCRPIAWTQWADCLVSQVGMFSLLLMILLFLVLTDGATEEAEGANLGGDSRGAIWTMVAGVPSASSWS